MSGSYCTLCDDYGHASEDHKMSEDRYEALEIIIKARDDGESWFDIFYDLVTSQCQGDPDIEDSCTCGLEAMGGMTGTLDQAYRHQGIADDLVGPVDKSDLMTILNYINECPSPPSAIWQAYKKLLKECTWWEDTLASIENYEEEEKEK